MPVLVEGRRGPVMAGDHSGLGVGDAFEIGKRRFVVSGVYHSGNRFEDVGVALPLVGVVLPVVRVVLPVLGVAAPVVGVPEPEAPDWP